MGAIVGEKMKGEDFLMNRYEPSRTRTCDPLVKSQLLYRLSYRPTRNSVSGILPTRKSKVQSRMSKVIKTNAKADFGPWTSDFGLIFHPAAKC